MKNLIVIDNEVLEVINIHNLKYGFTIELDNNTEYNIFQDIDDAYQETYDYYQDIAENDKNEFRCIVGDENIIEFWISGTSFENWLNDVASEYVYHLAGYDHEEIEIFNMNKNLQSALNFSNECLAFRHN